MFKIKDHIALEDDRSQEFGQGATESETGIRALIDHATQLFDPRLTDDGEDGVDDGNDAGDDLAENGYLRNGKEDQRHNGGGNGKGQERAKGYAARLDIPAGDGVDEVAPGHANGKRGSHRAPDLGVFDAAQFVGETENRCRLAHFGDFI